MYAIVDGIVYYIDHKSDVQKRAVVPQHIQQQNHSRVSRGPIGRTLFRSSYLQDADETLVVARDVHRYLSIL